jgi:hypothetical protein
VSLEQGRALMVQQVARLITKKDLATDRDTQTLEDALCLLFLEAQFADLKHKTADETLQGVLRKTWQKMSAQGRAEAKRLPLGPDDRAYLSQALGEQF